MRLKIDLLLFSQIIALGAISLIVIFSLNKSLATSQLVFWLFGLSVFLTVSQINPELWRKYSTYLYLFCLVALVSLLFFASPARGAVRWFDLGAFRFQPSELTKIAVIFLLSRFYLQRSARQFKNIVLSLPLITPAAVLIFSQPDIGSTLSLFAIWLGITYVAGARVKTLLVLLLVTAACSIIAYDLLASYQKERIRTFVDPTRDPLGTGYNIIQSKISVGSGKFLGRGLGKGSQSVLKFLPEAESDFIFASISEQLGFLGAFVLLVLFLGMVARITRFASSENSFSYFLVAGVSSYLIFQFTVNVGMNVGLIPVTGITLPLVSYGGSSLISTLFLLGTVLATKNAHQNQKLTFT